MRRALLTVQSQTGRPKLTKDMIMCLANIAGNANENTTVFITDHEGQTYTITSMEQEEEFV